MDAMACTELPATAMGPPHELRRRCLWLIRQEPFCLAIAVEDGQTEYIFECRANIVANGHHKRADQSRTEWIELEQSVPATEQYASDVTVSEKEATEMSSRDCKRRARMRPSPPTAARMRAKRMIDAMKCTELSAAAPGPPSRSEDALSRADEAGAILPRKCGRSVIPNFGTSLGMSRKK